MSDRPKLVFGQGPISFEDALLRLPTDDHPLIHSDQGIGTLWMLRTILQQTMESKTDRMVPYQPGNLDDRMVTLDREELKMMEQYSFRRRNWGVEEKQWATLWDKYNPWAGIYYTGDNEYKRWRISKMEPQPAGYRWVLICIETNSSYDVSATQEYSIGLVTHLELKELLDGLDLIKSRLQNF